MKYLFLILFSLSTYSSTSDLVKEYLNSSSELKSVQYLWDNQKILLELENNKRPWTLSYSGEKEDSGLAANPFSLAPANQKITTQVFGLSKSFILGSKINFSGTLYEFESTSSFKSYSQSVSYSQDLGQNFFGRNDRLKLAAAKDSEQFEKLNFQSNKSKKLFSFIVNLIDLRRDITLVELQKRALKRSQKRVNLVKRQVRDGLKEKVDLFSSMTSHRFQIEQVIEANSSLAQSRTDLNSKLERNVSLVEFERYELVKEELPKLPKALVNSNLSIRAIDLKLSSLNKIIKSTDNSIFPNIELIGTYATNNYEDAKSPISDGTFGSDNSSKAIALSISVPLGFNIEKNARKSARLNHFKSLYDKKTIVVRVTNSVLRISEQIELTDQNISSVITRYALAKKTLKEYNKLYNRGRADLDQVIRAEEGLINTERSFVQYKTKREKLFYALLDLYGQLESEVSL